MAGDRWATMPWWVTTIVLAFIVNLLSTFAAPLLEKLARHSWSGARSLVARYQGRFDTEVERLRQDRDAELDVRLERLGHMSTWSGYLTLGALFGFLSAEMRVRAFGPAAIGAEALLVVFVVASLAHYSREHKLARLLDEVGRRRHDGGQPAPCATVPRGVQR